MDAAVALAFAHPDAVVAKRELVFAAAAAVLAVALELAACWLYIKALLANELALFLAFVASNALDAAYDADKLASTELFTAVFLALIAEAALVFDQLAAVAASIELVFAEDAAVFAVLLEIAALSL